MLKSTMKTEIRVNGQFFEVWYSTDGGQTNQFHKKFKSMDSALKETVSMKGYSRLMSDLKR